MLIRSSARASSAADPLSTGTQSAPPPTLEERAKMGHTQRKHVSRAKLGEFPKRPTDFHPLEILRRASSEDRVAKLLPFKYERMSASPFAFFRGAVSIMAADLARQPHSGLFVQLCGDAHVQNMGSFEGPDGSLVFDINDFDETIAGPWEWDVKRMGVSLVLAGWDSHHSRTPCEEALHDFLYSYCTLMERLAKQPILTAARYQIHRAGKVTAVNDALAQAQRASPCDLLFKYATGSTGGRFHFKKIDNVLWAETGAARKAVLRSLDLYRESLTPAPLHFLQFFEAHDVAFKIVGTGSVGLRDYLILLQGNGPDDPLFLQVKQETRSAYAPYLHLPSQPHQGRRVAEGQRRIQPLSDPLLGWTHIGPYDYLVRQLNDHKGSIDLDALRGDGLRSLAGVAGELLARGHARSGDAVAISSYIGKPDRICKSLAAYCFGYAHQTQKDFQEFQNFKKARKPRKTENAPKAPPPHA